MAHVTIYTKMFCPYCARALKLLRDKGVAVEEIAAGFNADLRQEMIDRSGGRTTFPQIFVDGRHVGDSDEIAALEREGRLDALLAGGGAT